MQRKRFILSLLIFLFLLTTTLLTVDLVERKQEIRTKAQLPDCQSLTYPCQEGLISFPNDEGKHRNKQVEWWYANFNVNTSPGFIPLAGAIALVRANPGRGDRGYALLEITDESASKFFYRVLTGTITSSVGKQDISFTADRSTEVKKIRFYQSGGDFQYKLEITGDGIEIILTLKSQKRPLVEGGDGYVPIFANYPSEESGYYSLTKLLVSNGQVDLPDTPPFAIKGISWIDHQWFNVPTGISPFYDPSLLRPHHEWFSIQLDNNTQIVAWEILKGTFPNLTVALKNLDIINAAGTQTHYENFTLDPYAYWDSPGGRFAQAWRLQREGEIDLTIQTTIPNQYVAPYKTYEGSTTITGKYKGAKVQGQGFAEMTLKYDSSCSSRSEICDKTDNDCDYRIDEFCQQTCAKEREVCYGFAGLPCCEGLTCVTEGGLPIQPDKGGICQPGKPSPKPTLTPIPTPTPSFSLSLSPGWNQIVWPGISGKKASDTPPECPIAVSKENFWFTPFVKNFGGVNFNFESGKIYYLKCGQAVTWNL